MDAIEFEQVIAENTLLKKQNADLIIQLGAITEQVKLLQQRLFGRKSETHLEPNPDQPSLFDEAEIEADLEVTEPELEQITYARRKPTGKREADLTGLPVEQVIHELPEAEQVCPDCQGKMHACGRDVYRKELTITPARHHVTEHVQTVYSCRNCDKTSHRTPMLKAPVPAPVVKGSGLASPSLVAHIANQKYSLALPLHRQEQEFARNNLPISRQTMANWLIYAAGHWLAPIYEALKTQLLAAEVLHADETTVQVLKEEGKAPTSKSYMWLYRTSGDAEHPIVLYEYQPNRKHENAKQFLTGFNGYLHADGYDAYHNLPDDIVTVGCWAHVRRKFADLLKSIPDYNKAGSIPMQAIKYCDRLFALERDFADLPFQERYQQRLEHSKPIMNEFFTWAQKTYGSNPLASPRSATGKALSYAFNQRKYLENVLKDGRLELSNNRGERSIKPFVIGRKNWTFSNSEKGATASSIIYSIIETAKENHLKPYEYLKYIFEVAPNTDLTDPEALAALLPANAPAICHAPHQLTFNQAAAITT